MGPVTAGEARQIYPLLSAEVELVPYVSDHGNVAFYYIGCNCLIVNVTYVFMKLELYALGA